VVATWLDMTNKLLLLIAIAGCTTSPPPEKVYDFSGRELSTTVPGPVTSRSPKALIRRAIDQLQPNLARCTTGTSGVLDITLRIELSTDLPAVLDSVDVDYSDKAAAVCVRDVLSSIDLSPIETREYAVWVVHTPFVVAVNQ
jgi:hypothetical protein